MKLTKPINILVQRRASIGDVIMTTGVVRELKRRYGDNAVIDVATDCGEVYRNNPHIRNIFPVDVVPPVNNKYDLYFNLDNAYENNPYTNFVDNYFFRVFGDANLNKAAELFANDDDRAEVDRDLEDFGNKFVVVHMRNWHWAAKNIDMSVWYEIFEKVFTVDPLVNFICAGSDSDYNVEHPNFFDARGKYNTQQLAYLCNHARAFVGIDSGPMHCAAASDTHIIALLTHLLPERIVPYRKWELGHNTIAIQTLEDCAGCNDRQQRPIRHIVCEKTNFPCTQNFDTTAIATAILNQL